MASPAAPKAKATAASARTATPAQVADHVEPTPSPPVDPDRIGATRPRGRMPQLKLKKPEFSKPAFRRPSVTTPDLGAARERATQAASTAGTAVRDASRRSADFVIDRWYDLRAWWLPAINPLRASALTGLVVGLVAVGLGAGSLMIFSQVRGVASGGGTWGSLTFVVLAFVAFALGERLLAGFSTPMPRLTSFLGVTLTLVAILGLFLGVADSTYAVVVVPLLAGACYVASHWLLALAEAVPGEVE